MLQRLDTCHDALWMYLPLVIRFSQDIMLGTLHLNAGKIALGRRLPAQPANKGEMSMAPSPLHSFTASLSASPGNTKGAQLDLTELL